MIKGSVDSIETFGLVDGPGIRTVVFLNGCNLRCKYCHNPEMWKIRNQNYTSDEIVKKVIRNKPYFRNKGGVTFSGGEPLLQYEFLVETCQKLKEENIHIAIDTAGIGKGNYKELLNTIDMVLLDIKHITNDGYQEITGTTYLDKFFEFVKELNETNVEVWIRQVIIPDINDNEQYLIDLSNFLKKHIKNVTRIDFLPYHKLGEEKYKTIGIDYPYKEKKAMDKTKCDELYKKFMEIYEKNI
jgi:pyruvate formate lyase activating enzyme